MITTNVSFDSGGLEKEVRNVVISDIKKQLRKGGISMMEMLQLKISIDHRLNYLTIDGPDALCEKAKKILG